MLVAGRAVGRMREMEWCGRSELKSQLGNGILMVRSLSLRESACTHAWWRPDDGIAAVYIHEGIQECICPWLSSVPSQAGRGVSIGHSRISCCLRER